MARKRPAAGLPALLALAAVGFAAPALGAQEITSPTSPQLPAQNAPAPKPSPLPRPPIRSRTNCPFAGKGLRITLTRVVVQGATVLRPRDVDRAVADLIGRDSDLGVVCTARDRIAALYVRKGYRLARVELEPQRIAGGLLTLRATEGYVARIESAGLAPMGPSRALVKAFVQPLAKQRPTSWSAIESAVLMSRDIPGAQVEIGLRPSPEAPGALELIAASARVQHFDISTGVQNMGTRALGEVAGSVRFDANSFTPFGERTSLLLYGTTTGDQKSIEGAESVFLGSSGLRGTADFSYTSSQPKGALSPLGIDGDSYDGKLGLDIPVRRGQALDIVAHAGFEYEDDRNSLGALEGAGGGTPLLFHDKLRIVTLQGDVRWAPEATPELSVNADVELRQGVIGLGSSREGDADLSRASGDAGALVLRGSQTARWTFGGRPGFGRLGGPWVELTGELQWTQRPLLASEQFQIGNFTLARGYDPGAASGDRAWGGEVQAGWPLPLRAFNTGAVVEPFVFYDAVHLQNLGSYVSDVASVGGGFHTALPWALHLDIIGADPLRAPLPSSRVPASRLLVSLNRVFLFQ